MPYTLNGIGTRYIGAKNRSGAVGTCASCKKSATLSSYDTREWFCFAYLPLIPLTKYRVINDCSRCRRHHRMTAKEFQQNLEQKVAPLKDAIQRSPRDPQPRMDLIQTLIGWQMQSEAQSELDAALTVFPDNVELLLTSGQLAVGSNDFTAALAFYERARRVDPQNAAVAYSIGWLLHETGRHDQAIPVLQQAATQSASRAGALYLLGDSCMKLMRWQEALHAFQQLLSVEPKYTADKALLRLMRECKLKLGYPLNDAERRAGRRWWPFGGKRKRAAFQKSGPASVRPGLKIAGIAVAAVAVFSMGFVGWDRWWNQQLYVDNALGRRVNIDLDGDRFNLNSGEFEQKELQAGPHIIVVRETSGKEIEKRKFDIERMSPLTSILHERFFVYNVASQRIYRRANVGYAEHEEDSSYSEELVGMQPFFEVRDVDYAFTSPPESIEMDAGSKAQVKVAFNPAHDVSLAKYSVILASNGKTKEAMNAIQLAVATAPCDTAVRRTQLLVVTSAVSEEAGSKVAKQWIATCRENDLEAQRSYQDLNIAAGRFDDLHDEYGKLLAGSPQSGELHYLYGRTIADPSASSAEFQKALELDPTIVWARAALARSYLEMGRYDDAVREYGQSLDMKGADPNLITYYAMAAISKGDPASVAARVDQWLKGNGKDDSALHARWLIAAASADWKKAAEIQKTLLPIEGSTTAWWRKMSLLRLQDDPAYEASLDTAMRDRRLRGVAAGFRAERYIEKGEFAPAARFIDQHVKELGAATSAQLEAYTAGGMMLHGETDAAKSLLADAERTLGEQRQQSAGRVAAMLIGGLRGTLSSADVMLSGRRENAIAQVWFVAAVRSAVAHDKAGAMSALDRCHRAASDLEFPYVASKSMEGML
ncbi:MAG TPA: tetratricopeptide repeat protein [Thermoanaerobaculia bacterium]